MEIWLPKINEADSLKEISKPTCTDINSSLINMCKGLFGLIYHDTVLIGSGALQRRDERLQLTLFTVHCHKKTCRNDKGLSYYSVLSLLSVHNITVNDEREHAQRMIN